MLLENKKNYYYNNLLEIQILNLQIEQTYKIEPKWKKFNSNNNKRVGKTKSKIKILQQQLKKKIQSR